MLSHYDQLKQKNDKKSKYVLESLHRTLDHFQIKDNRETIGEILLRFAIVEDENNLTSSDVKTKKLLEMLLFFKKEIGI